MPHNPFAYQGKEMQDGEFSFGSGLEMYDFSARFYDQQLGVWHNQDPSGQYASPYMAMGNN
jgi:RHS repeat-associated protein